MKIGLRTGEICILRIEDIDFDDGSFKVLDSKSKHRCHLPLDILTLQLLQELVRTRIEGYVFTQLTSWKNKHAGLPLTVQRVWQIVHGIALEAGVENLKPRDLRAYFAAKWALVDKKDRRVLRELMRHQQSDTTDIYIDKFIDPDDVRREYDRVVTIPFSEPGRGPCQGCGNAELCKYAPLPGYVTGCVFRVRREWVKN
jgi:integrase